MKKKISFSSFIARAVYFFNFLFLFTFFILPPLPLHAQQQSVLVPNLLVKKTVDKEQVEPGDTLNYTIWYANALNDTAYNVVLTDLLPDKTVFSTRLNPNWHVNTGNDTLFYNIGTVAPGDSGLIGLHLLVADQAEFSPGRHNILNIVEIRGMYHSILYSNKHAVISSLFLIPDLQIKKSHRPKYLSTYPGSLLTYNIIVKNTGNKAAENVVIKDTLSYLLSATGSQPYAFTKDETSALPDTVLEWIIPTLAPDSSTTIQVSTILTNKELLGMDMVINMVGVEINDEINLEDNSDQDTTYFLSGGIPARRDLQIQKTADRDKVFPGDTLVYNITYNNAGNLYSRDIIITEYFPIFTNFVDFSFSTPAHLADTKIYSDRIEWYLPSADSLLEPEASGSITLTFTVPDSLPIGEHVLIDSVVIGSSTCADSDSTNNIAIAATTISTNRDLEVMKEVSDDTIAPGGSILYTIRIKNLGNMPANNIMLIDSLSNKEYIEGIDNISAGGQLLPDGTTIKWEFDIIEANSEKITTFNVRTKDFSTYMEQWIYNYVEVTTQDPESKYDNNKDTTSTVVIYRPQLQMRILSSTDDPQPGEEFYYILRYRNIGTAEAKNVTLLDTIPEYVMFSGNTTDFPDKNKWQTLPSGNVEADSVIEFKLGSVPPKMSDWLEIKVFGQLDKSLPGAQTLLFNHGRMEDSAGFTARADNSLYTIGEVFEASIQIIPGANQDLPEKSLYLGSNYNLRVEVNKQLSSLIIFFNYPELPIIPEGGLVIASAEINQNYVDQKYIYETSSPIKVPDNAGFGRMVVYSDVTSEFNENLAPEDAATILKPPEEFKLNKNAINLTLGEVVTARFTLSKPEQVEISIYTVAGEPVRKLYDEKLPVAGEDQVEWDGKNKSGQLVAGGVYLFHLKTPSFEKVKKVIIIR